MQTGIRSDSRGSSKLDDYLQGLFQYSQHSAAAAILFEEAKANAVKLNKSSMSISSYEGRLLQFFISTFKCKKFIEVGTLTGYSALWILSAIGQGELLTFEKDEAHARCAVDTLAKWLGPSHGKVIVGDAREMLETVTSGGPFDGIFIDGNKLAYLDYLDWAEKNVRKGGLIIGDNVLSGGGVYGEGDGRFSDKQVELMKSFNLRLGDSSRYNSILIPTIEGMFVAEKLF